MHKDPQESIDLAQTRAQRQTQRRKLSVFTQTVFFTLVEIAAPYSGWSMYSQKRKEKCKKDSSSLSSIDIYVQLVRCDTVYSSSNRTTIQTKSRSSKSVHTPKEKFFECLNVLTEVLFWLPLQ
jgi:transposase